MRARWNEARIYLAAHPFAFALIEVLGRIGGTVRLPGIGVLVNDAVVARAVLEDEVHFARTGAGGPGVFYDQVMGGRALFNMDGEGHAALRRRVGDLFSPAYLRVVTGAVMSDPLADLDRRLRGGQEVDLVRFTHGLTGRMICHQLGIVPEPGCEEDVFLAMFALGEELVSPLRLHSRALSDAQLARARSLYLQLVSPARASFASGPPAGSLVERLRAAGLTGDEAEGVLGALFLAGTQTVSTALPRLVALLLDTGQMDRLRADPGLLRSAIDEGFRTVVPSPVMLRRVRQDARVGRRRFRAGERVVIATYNVARDRRVFQAPRRFDIGRHHAVEGRHMWFGAGQHFCLGFSLAHLEVASVIQALLELPAPVEVVRRRPARGVLIPAYAEMAVRLTAAPERP